MRVNRKRLRSNIGQALIYLVLTVGVLFWLIPFAWMLFSSFKPTAEIFTRFWPTHFTLEHYKLIAAGGTALKRPFVRSVFNNLFVSIVTTSVIVTTGAMTGYALARLEFKGRRLLSSAILYQMIFPGVLFLIPTFLLVLKMGLFDTYTGMMIRFLASATAVFLYAQFFRTIPQELVDAARIDGAGELTILWRIMIPLAGSVTAFVFLFNFMARWDEFLWNLIVVKNYDLMTLPVLLATFTKGEYGGFPGAQMAGATVLVMPILILFVLFRRFFEEGIVTTGLKG